MDLHILHVYPDLMSLYGSYANILVLKRRLEELGNTVSVQTIRPGQEAALPETDFLFMGAGTERAQKAALADFARYGGWIKDAARQGTAMLFAGTAMELLGKRIVDAQGRDYQGIALGEFTSTQGSRRFAEDVYGFTDLYGDAVVGFINKCSVIEGVETPLLHRVQRGYGNNGPQAPEGFRWNNVLASHLTGPVLVKNPRLLDWVVEAIYTRRSQPLPAVLPKDAWAEQGYAITARQLMRESKQ